MNVNQKNNYDNSDKCHICERFWTELPPRLEKNFKIFNKTIELYTNNNDIENIKKYKDKLEKETKNQNINMRKVDDHDHLTGKYGGVVYSIYNLTYQNSKFISIVCHNLSGYDAHLFIEEFGNDGNKIK